MVNRPGVKERKINNVIDSTELSTDIHNLMKSLVRVLDLKINSVETLIGIIKDNNLEESPEMKSHIDAIRDNKDDSDQYKLKLSEVLAFIYDYKSPAHIKDSFAESFISVL